MHLVFRQMRKQSRLDHEMLSIIETKAENVKCGLVKSALTSQSP